MNNLKLFLKKVQGFPLIKNMSVYVLANIVQKISEFILLPIWARFMLPEDYGITGTLKAYGGILSPFLLLGLSSYVSRQFFEVYKDHSEQKKVITSIFALQLLIALAITLTFNIIGGPLWAKFTTNAISFDPYVRIMLWSVFFASLTSIPLYVYQTRQMPKYYALLQYGAFVCNNGVTFILVVLLHERAYGWMLGTLIGNIVIAIVAISLLLRDWFSPKLSLRYMKDGVAYGLPMVPHQLAGWTNRFFDRTILERFVTLTNIGLYNFGYSIGYVLEAIIASFVLAWLPYYYRMMKEEEKPEQKVLNLFIPFLSLLSIITAIGILFSPEAIYLVLPEKYYGSIIYIGPVLFGYYFLGYYKIAASPLFYYKKTAIIASITFISAGLNILLNLLFIPQYGAIGAAWVTTGTYILTAISSQVISSRYQRLAHPYRWYIFITVLLFLCTIFVNIHPTMDIFGILIKLVLLIVVCITVYFLIRRYINKTNFSGHNRKS